MLYEKDKRYRLTLRVSEEQFQFLKTYSDVVGVSPSELLRMMVNASMYADKEIAKNTPPVETSINTAIFLKGQVNGRENDESHFNNIVQQ